MEQAKSTSFNCIWNRLPVMLRAVISGILVAAAGTLPWAFLARLNIDHLSSIPWSVPVEIICLWFFWKYVSGKGWPKSTSIFRKNVLRANPLPDGAWGTAIVAGMLGLVCLVLFSGLWGRFVRLPQQDISELSHVPYISVVFMILMGSVVAGVVEESAFRGYMQKPIEERHGPWVAIIITGIFFSLLHYSHPETTLSLMPFYFFVGTIYGMLAWLTKSILPGIILHVFGDIFGGLELLTTGQSEWQRPVVPKPLVWESGPDTSFWMLCIGFLIVGTVTIFAYKAVAREMRGGS